MKAFNLYRPPKNSHKGQNGKLLVIGGSELFHSGIFWSADVASRIVDLVHLTSPANENNQIFRKRLKEKFWNGIVVDWGEVESYIEEDDCVLIGPGMIRQESSPVIPAKAGIYMDNLYRFRLIGRNDNESGMTMKTAAKNDNTFYIVNYLLAKYPSKRWVIDGGALQEVDVRLITESCILTPHRKEFEGLLKRSDLGLSQGRTLSGGGDLSQKLQNCTILLKGRVDTVCQGKRCISIEGGNPGMTKGGTGDVLAGLVAGLYCKNNSWIAATMASHINKKAGDSLYKRVGPYFNAEDLVREVPLTIYGIIKGNV